MGLLSHYVTGSFIGNRLPCRASDCARGIAAVVLSGRLLCHNVVASPPNQSPAAISIFAMA